MAQEFKAKKDKHGRLTIMPNFERKANGDLICHMPSMQMIQEFKEQNG